LRVLLTNDKQVQTTILLKAFVTLVKKKLKLLCLTTSMHIPTDNEMKF